ncbi:PDR/VanB family oxidoreductase [Phaeobacter marinintestinus]|uniref:PDR/VanB family oxidoreductase n=1 Tax=Falsiphaeobacter marinintestinus TaxID=1492905 RepID=UPI0011B4D7BD|nr:PDR/VanB family oxidoreductase [Phaeobacter marinintestinus]
MQTYKITSITDVTDRVRQFDLLVADNTPLPAHDPGAHLDFQIPNVGERSYSLIDWPGNTDTFTIAVQREDDGDGGSQAMHGLTVGDTLKASGPINDFKLNEGDTPRLLIAGGIGVTPIISFATQLAARNAPFQFHVAARSAGICPFRETLETTFGPHLTFWFDDTNQIDLQTLIASATPETHIFCCGPKGMIEAVRERAESAGFAKDQIHFELFTSPATHVGDTPFEVEIADSGQVFTIPADKTIIEVLEAEGVDVMYDCARGDCGICQTDVISGTPDHRDVVLSDAERASGKVMQICVSRAKSARLVLDL